MALCKGFEELDYRERQEFIGKLTHLVQTNPYYFAVSASIIRGAEMIGALDNVTILPTENPLENESSKASDSGIHQ